MVYNKYYVDEFYDRVIIQPYLFATRALAWFDTNIIDGFVNLAAARHSVPVVAVRTIRPLCSRLAGKLTSNCDLQRRWQAAAAANGSINDTCTEFWPP